MEQKVRNLFIDTPFSTEGLNVQGFSIIEVSKGKLKKGKLLSTADFTVDAEKLLKVLENSGKVYGYTRKGALKALYVVTADGHRYSCDEVYFSSEIEGEPVTDLMNQQVVFLMAQRASYHKDGSAIFQGTKVPKLTTKQGTYNWYWAVTFALLYGVVFCTTLKSPAGIFAGAMMGLAMGFCFRSNKYEYVKDPEDGEKESETI
ncbi:MAG TPA: hypothetical protein DEO39_04815 [Clostridiales bacterium]|nr:hypothetical protein [Clostridiales bacterium]